MTITPAGGTLAFGPFTFDTQRRELLFEAVRVPLGGRAADLLITLLARPGEILSRDELVAAAWPRMFVEESSLRVQLAALRKALNQTDPGTTYVINIPGRGYSFVAPVRHANLSGESSWQEDAATEPGRWPVNNLPARLTAIIGRNEQIAFLTETLRSQRLVTIVAPGGAGKTTLAVAVAATLTGAFEDGVLFVDFSPCVHEDQVIGVLTSTFAVSAPHEEPLQELITQLRSRRLLVVLDNCEHVIESAALCAETMLKQLPHLHILATSRERLNVQGEWVHLLATLEMPPVGIELSVESATAYPAFALFVQRVTASQTFFELGDDDVPVACELCNRLDGIPLAIEFAAARVGQLGLKHVARHVDSLIAGTISGRRTSNARHQTLRAVLEWSYRLLTSNEKIALARLSVFRTPFSLADAVAVNEGGELEQSSIVQIIVGLCEKSLLINYPHDNAPRYRLLDVTRLFARERLDEMDDHNETYARHAALMLERTNAMESDWELMPEAVWASTYHSSLGEIRAAIEWAFSPEGDLDIGIPLTEVVTRSAYFPTLEARSLYPQILKAISAKGSESVAQVQLVSRLTQWVRATSGQLPLVRPALDETLARAERDGNTTEQIALLYSIWEHQYATADYLGAKQAADRANSVAILARDFKGSLHSDRLRAQAEHYLGNQNLSWDLANHVLDNAGVQLPLRYNSWIDRRVSMRIILARILWLRGFADQALKMVHETLDIASTGHPIALCQALSLAGIPIALWRGDIDYARSLIEQLIAYTSKQGILQWQIWGNEYQFALQQTECFATSENGRFASISPTLGADLADMLATLADVYVTDAVVARVEQSAVGWCAPEVLRRTADRLFAKNDAAGHRVVDALLYQSLYAALDQGALSWALRSAMSLARLKLAKGDISEAHSVISQVYNQFSEAFMTKDLRDARALLARIDRTVPIGARTTAPEPPLDIGN
ncbi:ATP-binding protein [Paraburkholderia sp. RL17-337-BIB-A]|uniref:ATP-binding protein n=1 Tax=Paraburkholderia sp. RL17-337-BIB-A TaxID=3031636 RepID=UPI0038B8CC6A